MNRRLHIAVAAAALALGIGIGAREYRARTTAPARATQSAPSASPLREAEPVDFMEVGEKELDELEAQLGLGELEPSQLDVPLTRRALHYVRFYSEDERGRRWFSALYRRSGAYRSAVEHGLREAKLPLELSWLVAAESSFDPNAESDAHAVGLWQLIPAVAEERGLRIDDWVDERRNVELSTRAATAHLRMLYDRLGSTDLVLAAYNAGSGRIEGAMDELRERRRERGESPSRVRFSHLAEEGLLPRETAEYVPRITAMAIVGANLGPLGFSQIEPDPELRTTPIVVEPETRLSTIARSAGITVAHLRKLNPELLMNAVPPGRERAVQVPAHRYNRALAVLPVYLDEDAEAADDLPEVEESPIDIPPHPPADFELVKARMELAKLLVQPPSSNPSLGHFGGFMKAGGVQLGAQPQKVMYVTGEGGAAAPTDARLEAEVSALLVPETIEDELGSGIKLRLAPNPVATRVTITVEMHGGEVAPVDPPLSTTMVHQAEGEVRYVDVLRPAELDVGLLLAAGRLALLYDQARGRPAAALRARLVRHRRLALEKTQRGAAWLALGDMIFHPQHPSFGRILDPSRLDAQTVRDRALLHEMPAMRIPARATVTIAGNFDPDEARKGAAFAVASVGLGIRGRERTAAQSNGGKHRFELEAPKGEALMLFAHLLPALDEPRYAASLVVLEILAGQKKSRLVRALADGPLASSVSTHVDPDWTSSVGTIVIAPGDGTESRRLEKRVDDAVAQLVAEGPSRVELAYAQAMLAIRLEKRLERVQKESGTLVPGKSFTSGARMLEALQPGYHERLIERVRAVDAKSVARAAKRHFRPTDRYVVEQRPRRLDGAVAAVDEK